MAHPTRRSSRNALVLAPLAALAVAAAIGCFAGDGSLPLPAPTSASLATAVGGPTATTASHSAAADRDRTVASRGFWTAPSGARFVHHVVDRCDFTLHSPEGGTQQGGALHSECDVETIVVDRRDGEALVRQRIHGLVFVGPDGRAIENDPIQASFAAATTAPVLVRIAAKGTILGYGFAADLDGDQRNFLRGTLNLFAFEAPAAPASDWTSELADTTGECSARYERLSPADADDVTVRRTRLAYTAIAGQAELPKHRLRGAAEGTFALELGWLRSARIDEGMTLSLQLLDLEAITARRADVTLLENGSVAVGSDLVGDWAAATAPATGKHEVIGGYAKDSERKRWQERLKGVTLSQLLADLQRILAAEPVDAEAVDAVFQQMQWLLKLDDTLAAQLAQQVATRQVNEAVARVALGALGAAGTVAAQDALTAVRGDAGVGADVREAATVACVQLDEPTANLVASLVRDADAASTLQRPSMLVLGALAPKAKDKLADGRSPVQRLLAMENDAAGRGDTSTWLLAVGNAGAPETLGIVQRHVDNGDPTVRAAACVALRRVADADAIPLLADRATTDTDAGVRRDAVLELGRRSGSGARQAIEYVAQHDANEALRDRARRMLGQG